MPLSCCKGKQAEVFSVPRRFIAILLHMSGKASSPRVFLIRLDQNFSGNAQEIMQITDHTQGEGPPAH